MCVITSLMTYQLQKRVFVLAWLGVYMKLFSKNHSLRALYVFRLALIMSRLSCGLGEAFFRAKTNFNIGKLI